MKPNQHNKSGYPASTAIYLL